MDRTPDQIKNIKTWIEERDEILKQISVAKTENETLSKKNGVLAESNSDLEKRISANAGRVEILDKQEQEKELLCSQRIAKLITQETELIAKINGLQIAVNALVGRKGDLESMIKVLEDVHEKIFEKVGVLGQVVDHVKRVGSENTERANYLLARVRDELEGFLGNVRTLNATLNDKTTGLNASIDRTVKLHTQIAQGIIKKLADQGITPDL